MPERVAGLEVGSSRRQSAEMDIRTRPERASESRKEERGSTRRSVAAVALFLGALLTASSVWVIWRHAAES